MKENKYSISPFNYNKNNSFQESFYKEIEKLSVNLGINLSDLLSYKPEHAFYDHGVISASIMFQVISFNNELKNYCAEKGVLSLAQNRLPDLYKDELQMYAQCVFSILLHNIYNKKSKPAYGIDYYQNMDKDSFSYFCAFCDTIQRWGRPKQIDPAKTDLPEENYLEDEFDIHIADNRIYISCIEKYLKSIKNMINYAENFLPGISSLIKINLY